MQQDINQCIETLKAGGTLLYPTDTVWGIGADATNEAAVQKVIDLKHRGGGKSFIILVHNTALIERIAQNVPDIAWDMIEYAENPLTVVFNTGKGVAPNVLNADGSIAIRLVKEGFAYELLRKFGKPLISTSANISGQGTPMYYHEIDEAVINGVDYAVPAKYDAGTGAPSTIMKIAENGVFEFLRK